MGLAIIPSDAHLSSGPTPLGPELRQVKAGRSEERGEKGG
jgi:hypothetical protein